MKTSKIGIAIEYYDNNIFNYYNINNLNIIKSNNIEEIKNYIDSNQLDYLLVTTSDIFKALTKSTAKYGIAIPYNNTKIILSVNYLLLSYTPKLQEKLNISLQVLNNLLNNKIAIGEDIIHSEYYPINTEDIINKLQEISLYPSLVIDIETTGLSLKDSKIISIAFSWDIHNGIAFLVNDFNILKDFFINYKGKCIYHNACFDITFLLRYCFMQDWVDYKGLVDGLEIMTNNIDDTQIIAYLATNSSEGNELSLKKLALEYTGQYALEEIHNISKYSNKDILKYNLIDTLATNYIFNKYYPIMVNDNQLNIYNTIMLPSIKTIVYMQLIGIPMDINIVNQLETKLINIQQKYLNKLASNNIVKQYEWNTQITEFKKKNSELKKKFIPIGEFKCKFNPNSPKQITDILYNQLQLEIINTTDKGNPSSDLETLELLYKRLQYENKSI